MRCPKRLVDGPGCAMYQHGAKHNIRCGCRSETYLMMRTLRDMNMSKFVAEDVPLFISLIDDLFPSQKAERAHFPDISAALDKVSAPL